MRLYRLITLLALIALAPFALAQALVGCGSLESSYGPFDYNDPIHFSEKLPIVESGHFDDGVESLRGHRRHPLNLAGDLDYTLRAFPNHHRALFAMARYQWTAAEYKRKPTRYSARCYFDRAIAFKPHDGIVRLIYGVYLFKTDKIDESLQRFQEALELEPDSAEVHYNLGLVLTDTGDLAGAKKHADIAYELGHPMPGLRNKLKRAGAW